MPALIRDESWRALQVASDDAVGTRRRSTLWRVTVIDLHAPEATTRNVVSREPKRRGDDRSTNLGSSNASDA